MQKKANKLNRLLPACRSLPGFIKNSGSVNHKKSPKVGQHQTLSTQTLSWRIFFNIESLGDFPDSSSEHSLRRPSKCVGDQMLFRIPSSENLEEHLISRQPGISPRCQQRPARFGGESHVFPSSHRSNHVANVMRPSGEHAAIIHDACLQARRERLSGFSVCSIIPLKKFSNVPPRARRGSRSPS